MATHKNVSYQDTLEIIFAERNKAYGAYYLRRNYNQYLKKAFTGGLLIIGFMVALPYIVKAVNEILPDDDRYNEDIVFTEVLLTPPPPPPPPTPPVPTPSPPVRSTQRFVPPVVDEDKNVEDDMDKLSVDDLTTNTDDIGTNTQKVEQEGQPNIDEPFDPGPVVETSVVEPETVVEMFDVNKPPTFPGGEQELLKFLAENIKYPALAREANIQGNVAISFVIGKDGAINDVQLLRDIGGGCGKEAIRVVKTMPNWSPGEANGHKVKVRFTLPVRFRLE
jgi:periplasmic protein TonB